MEIQYIREFLSLTETESYFETAEEMFITTSSLSRHIKVLEEEIGVTLFDRTTRRVALNRHGKLFLPFAKEIVRIDEECTKAFATDRHEQAGRISIGSIPMMRAYRITDLLAEFQNVNKAAEIDLTEGDPFVLLPRLQEGEIDFAFLRESGALDENLDKVPFTTDHLCIVVPKGHPFSRRETVSVTDLKEESLLMIGKDAYMYKLCCDLCREAGFEPNVRFTSHRAENLIDIVGRGMGIAMLMRKPASTFINENCQLVDISPEVQSIISLVWKKNRKLSPVHMKFIEMTKRIRIE